MQSLSHVQGTAQRPGWLPNTWWGERKEDPVAPQESRSHRTGASFLSWMGSRFGRSRDVISSGWRGSSRLLCAEQTLLTYKPAAWVSPCLKPALSCLARHRGLLLTVVGSVLGAELLAAHTRTLSCPPEMGSETSSPHNSPLMVPRTSEETQVPTKLCCANRARPRGPPH